MKEKWEKHMDRVWLLAVGLFVAVCSLSSGQLSPWGKTRTMGLVLLAAVALLAAFKAVTGRISWTGLISEEKEKGYSQKVKRRLALIQLVFFALATALYAWYCFGLSADWAANSIRDALTAGGLLCAAAVLPKQIAESYADTSRGQGI